MSTCERALEKAGVYPHRVQLYGADERFLSVNVSRYIRDGLKAGDGVAVFAAESHLRGFQRELNNLGVNVEIPAAQGQLAFVDAEETLASFMNGNTPDAALFASTIRKAIRRIRPRIGSTGLRAYGEMVGLLWSAGNHEAAIQLEEWWNELIPALGLQLFCGYPINIFDPEFGDPAVLRVLETHTHMAPAGENGNVANALEEAFHASAGVREHSAPDFAPNGGVRTTSIPAAEQRILDLRAQPADSGARILTHARQYYEHGKRFRALIENSSDGVSITDLDGIVEYASTSAARILGLVPEDLIGCKIFDLFHPDNRQSCRDLFRTAVEVARAPVELRARVRRGDGNWIWVENTINNLLDEPGISGVVWNFRDITDKRRAELALRNANEGLEQFAYAAAHDLQEPIRNVILYSQLLGKRYPDQLDGEALTFMRIIVESAQRMQLLISDLLAYTRSLDSAGEQVMSTDANRVMEEVRSNLATTIQETGASVTFDPLPCLPVYRAHLFQLLHNMVANALKYRSPEAARVHVSAKATGDEFVISVLDNGIGIAADHRERIFGIFRRLHGREIPGSGMGLAICYRIVTHYQGRIWVESELGQGSTFSFTIPCAGTRGA